MGHALTFTVMLAVSICYLQSLTEAYIIERLNKDKPLTYKDVCYFKPIDDSVLSQQQSSPIIPYFSCDVKGLIIVDKCELSLATREQCPLQFVGLKTPRAKCDDPNEILNSDCTLMLKNVCDDKVKCVFSWNNLNDLECLDIEAAESTDLPNTDQIMRVTYRCLMKRRGNHPFSHKRYDRKFSAHVG